MLVKQKHTSELLSFYFCVFIIEFNAHFTSTTNQIRKKKMQRTKHGTARKDIKKKQQQQQLTMKKKIRYFNKRYIDTNEMKRGVIMRFIQKC